MARRSNPNLSSLLPMLVLGGAAAYFFTKGRASSDPALKQVQVALNNFMDTVAIDPATKQTLLFGKDEIAVTGLFDADTSAAYIMAGNIVSQAQTNAGAALSDRALYQIIPPASDNLLKTDSVLKIDNPTSTPELRVSSAFLKWLLRYFYSANGQANSTLAYDLTFRQSGSAKMPKDLYELTQAATVLAKSVPKQD